LKYGAIDKLNIISGYNCAITIDNNGNLYSWGWNKYGQLGLGDKNDKEIPEIINWNDKSIKISTIAGGGGHSLSIDNNGNAYAWG
jgi:alpha-tubulin suppressor-like RCC1 family protein